MAFHTAWQNWRGKEAAPTTAQVRPEDLGPALRGISVLGANAPDNITYRIIGAVHENAIRVDLTGKKVTTMVPDGEEAPRLIRLWSIAAVPCGAVADMIYVRPSGAEHRARRLFLPVLSGVADEPRRTYMAMDMMGKRIEPHSQDASLTTLQQSFNYIDIGYGIPE